MLKFYAVDEDEFVFGSFLIFLNHSMVVLLYTHWVRFEETLIYNMMLSGKDLVIMSISHFLDFIKLVPGFYGKLYLWSFQVTKGFGEMSRPSMIYL